MESWRQELCRGTVDAYLAILLVQLPRLRHLRLEPTWFMKSSLIGDVVARAGNFAPSLSACLDNLETVSLAQRMSSHHHGVPNTQSVLSFLYLPSLRKMTLSIDKPPGPSLPWPLAYPPRADRLVSLTITHLRESHLGQLLSCLPRLRFLHWEWHFEQNYEDEYNNPIMSLDMLIPALAYVKHTLTELILPARCHE